jgi:copper chaperone
VEKGGIIMQNVTLQVEGMSCQHCEGSVEKALKEVGATVEVNLVAKSVAVQFAEI